MKIGFLSHYRLCRDPACPACEPLREAIKRSHEKNQRAPLLDSRGRSQKESIPAPQSQNSWNFRVASPLLPAPDTLTHEHDKNAPPFKRIKLDDAGSNTAPITLEPPTTSAKDPVNLNNPPTTSTLSPPSLEHSIEKHDSRDGSTSQLRQSKSRPNDPPIAQK